ncbi:L-cystine-binding protein TcyA precursor [Clostridium puniceum]|uniref:L-cystine-binding protein TcyA n=1 Tax=Clostridium puniceum TaxID=29367 RepID=A0A1S8TPC3_9CLOT|nr:transporter substrate-binding domain-containing protein [Clostridium puniceum]OOM79618.1 L-cystine-binding protein TcyA precursor [Clostridium puniceum]
MRYMKRVNKLIGLMIASVFIVGAFTACGNQSMQKSSTEPSQEKQKIVAATSGSPAPFVYMDNNNIVGYDIEVLKEIFRRLPQYELEFQKTEFASIFAGLDSGRYQIGCNHLGYNAERAKKYIFTDEMCFSKRALLVRNDNTDIKSIDDIGGHSTEVTATSFNTDWFEKYNKSHTTNPVILKYVEEDHSVQDVSDGKIDFEFFTKATIQQQIKDIGLKNLKLIDVSKEDFSEGVGNFFIVPKGQEKLGKDMDEAFEAALTDGTILKISQKYFEGEDYTPTLEDIKKEKEKQEKDQ